MRGVVKNACGELMDGNDFQGRYVEYREHAEFKHKVVNDLAAVRMETATLRARLDHLPEDFRELAKEVRTSIEAHNQGMALLAQKLERTAVTPLAAQPLISKDDIANMVRQAKGGSSNIITLAVIGMLGLFAYLFLHKIGVL